MADKKNILPPPINPQEKPITVAILTGKLDSLFENVKELVKSTARGTENAIRKELTEKIDGVEKRLSNRIDSVEKNLSQVEKNLSEKIDKIGEKVEGHETRLSAVEEKLETHLTTHP